MPNAEAPALRAGAEVDQDRAPAALPGGHQDAFNVDESFFGSRPVNFSCDAKRTVMISLLTKPALPIRPATARAAAPLSAVAGVVHPPFDDLRREEGESEHPADK